MKYWDNHKRTRNEKTPPKDAKKNSEELLESLAKLQIRSEAQYRKPNYASNFGYIWARAIQIQPREGLVDLWIHNGRNVWKEIRLETLCDNPKRNQQGQYHDGDLRARRRFILLLHEGESLLIGCWFRWIRACSQTNFQTHSRFSTLSFSMIALN